MDASAAANATSAAAAQLQWDPAYSPFPSPLANVAWLLRHGNVPQKYHMRALRDFHHGMIGSRRLSAEASAYWDACYTKLLNDMKNFYPLIEPHVFRSKDKVALSWVRPSLRSRLLAQNPARFDLAEAQSCHPVLISLLA